MSKILFMFPGVGSQYVGMGEEFYRNHNVARETFEQANEILKKDLADLCFSSSKKDELNKLENAQMALVVLSVATYRVYMQEVGAGPHYCMGHSLGEFSALCCAGVIQFPDVLLLVKERGNIIKNAAASLDGTMMWVINIDTGEVEDVCEEVSKKGEGVFVSAYDSPTQSSISGYNDSVMKAAKKLEERGAIVYPLKLSGPFHSPLMKSAAEQMKTILQQYDYEPPLFPVLANRNAQPYQGPGSVVDNLSLQLVSPIRWQESVAYVSNRGTEIAVEIGPKDVLTFLMKKNSDSIRTYTLDKDHDLHTLKEKLVVSEDERLALIGRTLGVVASTRNYNDDQQEYIENVIAPYRKIESLYKELSSNGRYPTRDQANQALQMLCQVLQTKKLPLEEQQKNIDRALKGKVLI